VSVATPGSKHWRVDLLEADDPAGLADAPALTVLPGNDRTGVKDPVILHDGARWHLWASCHPLESDEHADRMSTWYATSPDGVEWSWAGVVLAGRPGRWDARGVRLSSVTVTDGGVLAAYDGRATAGEKTGRSAPAGRTATGCRPGTSGRWSLAPTSRCPRPTPRADCAT
jgi:hypothetical protein